jgi:hypothetical protein
MRTSRLTVGTHRRYNKVMPTNGNSKFTIRMEDEPKAQFTAAAYNAGTTAAELVRQMIAWWMRTPGAELPARPGDDPNNAKDWNEAVDWLLNSRHTADPDIQSAFWGLAEGRFTREQADTGVFKYDEEGHASVSAEEE